MNIVQLPRIVRSGSAIPASRRRGVEQWLARCPRLAHSVGESCGEEATGAPHVQPVEITGSRPAASKGQCMLKQIVFVVGGLVVLAFLGLAGGFLWLRSSLPQVEGTVTLTGLKRAATIVRDQNAVPHIFAASPEDAAFALG